MVSMNDVKVESINEIDEIRVVTNETDLTGWSFEGVQTSYHPINVSVYDESYSEIEFIKNSRPSTEMLGYHKVGFIDGSNCDMWPKQVDFSEVNTQEITNRFTATGAIFDPNIDSLKLQKIADYMGKANTKSTLIFGSKFGFILTKAAVKYRLNGNSTATELLTVAIDPATNIGYVLDPRYICSEDDLALGICEFLSRNNILAGNAGEIVALAASGYGIDNKTQILTRLYNNRRENEELFEQNPNTVVIAAPNIKIPVNYIKLGLNTILLSNKITGIVDNLQPKTKIDVEWVGNGTPTSTGSTRPLSELEVLKRVWAYTPTPSVLLVAANNVTGIKEVKTNSIPPALSSHQNIKPAHALVRINTRAYWEGLGYAQQGMFYDRVEVGSLHEDNMTAEDYYPNGTDAALVELEALELFTENISGSGNNKKITWTLELPTFHEEVEGGFAAVYSKDSFYYAKGSTNQKHNAPAYKRNTVQIFNQYAGAQEVVDALYYKMYSSLLQMQDYSGFSEIELCIKSKNMVNLFGSENKCLTVVSGSVEIERYCLNGCVGDSIPTCINDQCPSDGEELPTSDCGNSGGLSSTKWRCYNVGENPQMDASTELNFPVSSFGITMPVALMSQKDMVQGNLRRGLAQWKNSIDHIESEVNGPLEEGPVAPNLTKDIQFTLSNTELFNLYLQAADRADDAAAIPMRDKNNFLKLAYELFDALPMYYPNSPRLTLLFAKAIDNYFKTNRYVIVGQHPYSVKECALRSDTFEKLEEYRNPKQEDLLGIKVNSIDMPYGSLARSWYQLSNFDLANEGEDYENPSYMDPYLNSYAYVSRPTGFDSYIQRWYKLQDSINILLTTLRDRRQDAIFTQGLQERMDMMGEILTRYADQQINTSSKQIYDFKMLVDSLIALEAELNESLDGFARRAQLMLGCDMTEEGLVCNRETGLVQMLNEMTDRCYGEEYINTEMLNTARDVNGYMTQAFSKGKTLCDKIRQLCFDENTMRLYEMRDNYLMSMAMPEYFGVYENLGEVSDVLGEMADFFGPIGEALGTLSTVLEWIFGTDPCPGNDRAFLEMHLAEFQIQLLTISQIVESMRISSQMIQMQLQQALLTMNYHGQNIENQETFLEDIASWRKYVNLNWRDDQYDRVGLGSTCEGLRLSVEAAKREIYSASQIMYTTLGQSEVPPYVTLPASWSPQENAFKRYPRYGFHTSLWDNLSNYRFQLPAIMQEQEYDAIDSSYREKVLEARKDYNEDHWIVENIEEKIESMTSGYASLLAESVDNLKLSLGDGGQTFMPFTYVVKTLERIPCYYEAEDTGEMVEDCDENGENCQATLLIEQPRYCDRSSFEVCPDEDCHYAGPADAFLSKGVTKFTVSPQDLGINTYESIVDENGIHIAPPVVYEVRYKVYYADYWCEYDAQTGMQVNCCITADLDNDPSTGVNPLECPDGGVHDNFYYYENGFPHKDDQGNLFIVNAAAWGLEPLRIDGELTCNSPVTVSFKGLSGEIAKRAVTCPKPLLSWYERQHLFHEDAATTGNGTIVNDYRSGSIMQDMEYLYSSHIRGLPVLGSWYLVYDGDRAEELTRVVRSHNRDYGYSIPSNLCYNEQRDTDAPDILMSQIGQDYPTPYSYQNEFDNTWKDVDKISRIDVVFVVARLKSPVAYWKEVE